MSIASSFFEKTGYFAHWCARTWSHWILKTTGVEVDVTGLDQLDPRGTYVFVANHQSIYDIPILFWSLPHQLRIIAKESLGNVPVIGWHLRRTGHMLVDRSRPDRAKIFGWASKLTTDGLSLCIYPEGTRSLDGKLHKGHTGVARLALEMRVPVIPVAMVGTFEAKPKGGKTRYFTKTAAIVGKPLDFSAHWGQHHDKQVCREVTDQVMRAIQQLSGQEYVDAYQHNPHVPSHAKPHSAPDGAHTGHKGHADHGSHERREP